MVTLLYMDEKNVSDKKFEQFYWPSSVTDSTVLDIVNHLDMIFFQNLLGNFKILTGRTLLDISDLSKN